MDESSTQNKLILYLFNETELTDTVLIQKQIDHDPEIECELENLKASLGILDKALLSPSTQCVREIMGFASKSLS
jgi:hypothetical protein